MKILRAAAVIAAALTFVLIAPVPASADSGAGRGVEIGLPPLLPGEQRMVIETADGTLVFGHIPASSGAGTQSFTRCQLVVCISVVGQSNFVSSWDTTAINAVPTCTWADWLHNTTIVMTTTVMCAGPGVFYGDWNPNRTFPNGLACNRWFTLAGIPCGYILE